jgi:putative endonuclease
MRTKQPAVYILASKHNSTPYTGVTSNLIERVYQHKNDLAEGFTKRYEVHQLVWFELHEEMIPAITRERQIKKSSREWKLELIEDANPKWNDLWGEIF